MSTDERALRRRLSRIDGCELVWSKGTAHWKVYWQGRLVTTISGSPGGGRRSLENLLSQLRRAGIPI